jgi:hypothetical protein
VTVSIAMPTVENPMSADRDEHVFRMRGWSAGYVSQGDSNYSDAAQLFPERYDNPEYVSVKCAAVWSCSVSRDYVKAYQARTTYQARTMWYGEVGDLALLIQDKPRALY